MFLQINSTVRYFQCFIKNNFLFSHDMQKTVCHQRTSTLTVSAKITGLTNRRYNGDINAVDNEIEYNSVLERVEEHRQKSKAFLDNALADFC